MWHKKGDIMVSALPLPHCLKGTHISVSRRLRSIVSKEIESVAQCPYTNHSTCKMTRVHLDHGVLRVWFPHLLTIYPFSLPATGLSPDPPPFIMEIKGRTIPGMQQLQQDCTNLVRPFDSFWSRCFEKKFTTKLKRPETAY